MSANGALPASALAPAVNGAVGQVLETQTAKQWAAMVAGASRDGVHLQPEPDDGVPSCYRNLAGQRNAWTIYQRDGRPTAAVPGTSNHGYGTAVDVVITVQTLGWLRAHAAAYGFDNAEGASVGEDWHWVRTRTLGVGELTTTTTGITTEEETDMPTIKQFHVAKAPTDKYMKHVLVAPGTGWVFPWVDDSGEYSNVMAATFETGPSVEITDSLYQQFVNVANAVNPKGTITITQEP